MSKFKLGNWVVFKNIPFKEGKIIDFSINKDGIALYLVKMGIFKKKWFTEDDLLLMQRK